MYFWHVQKKEIAPETFNLKTFPSVNLFILLNYAQLDAQFGAIKLVT